MIELPPSSSAKLTCNGWCMSPMKWAKNIKLSVKLSGEKISISEAKQAFFLERNVSFYKKKKELPPNDISKPHDISIIVEIK